MYLAGAPKSNSVYTAHRNAAMEDAAVGRARAHAPARRELPGRPAAGPRQGIPVPPRLPGTPGRAGVPARPVLRTPVLRALRARAEEDRGALDRRPSRPAGLGMLRDPSNETKENRRHDRDRRRHRTHHPRQRFWALLVAVPVYVLHEHAGGPAEHEDPDRHDARGDRAAAARGEGVGGAGEPRARPGGRDAGERERRRGQGREALRPRRAGRRQPAREAHQLRGRRPAGRIASAGGQKGKPKGP